MCILAAAPNAKVVITVLSRNNIRAMLLMVAGIATLLSMDAAVKLLVTTDIHAIQILGLRSVMIGFALLIIFKLRKELPSLRPRRWRLQLVRSVIGFVAPCAFFMSLAVLPQADATVLFFTAPLIITVCSVIFLNERFGIHRWVAVIVGFIGVAVAIDPEFAHGLNSNLHSSVNGNNLTINPGNNTLARTHGFLLALAGSVAYAVLFLLGRHLSKTESTPSLVMAYNVGVGTIALLLLPWFWTPMTAHQFAILILLATLAVIGHFCITTAFANAEASLLSPIEYTSLFWAIFYDWLLWQHAPNTQTLVGGTVVILAGLYFIHRERLSSSV